MLGGRLLKTENKQISWISGLKSACCQLRNVSSDCLQESFWTSIWLKNKTVIFVVDRVEVVDYEKWLLWESWLY